MNSGDSLAGGPLVAENARLRDGVASLRRSLDAERAVRRSVVDAAPDFIVHCDLDGRILFVNRVASGFRREEVVGAPFTDFAPPEYAETIRRCIADVARTGEPSEFESSSVGAHGEHTHFLNRVAPVKDGDEVVSVVFYVADVGRLKAAESALEVRDERLRVALEAAKMGVAELDVARGVIDADARFREVVGIDDEPFFLERALSIVVPEDLPALVAEIERAKATGTYRSLDCRIKLPSGATRWVQVAGQRRREGGATRLIATVVDIDERKKLEGQLAQAQKLESIGRLAGGVAHDFNNLLTAVLGSIALAEQTLEPGAPALEELAEIRRGVERGASLTSQLLAFARRQVIAPRVLSPSSLVAGVERLLARVLGEDIELSAIGGASGRVRVDPHQIERVLINLATNARDAMLRGGRLTIETVDVEVDEDSAEARAEIAPGPYVMLVVSDTGAGMTPETLAHVFEPFYTTKGFEQGTGLGLATCYGIVRQAGGFIRVSSEIGHGTTFRIYLPRVEADTDSSRPAPTSAAGGSETVLLVEDEPAIRRVLARTLRGQGYTVLEAERADDALHVARAHEGPIHVLITDVVMPGMGGRELADRLREVRPETATLYVSGYTGDTIAHHGVIDEGVDFLQKPFSPADLQVRIRRILDAKKR